MQDPGQCCRNDGRMPPLLWCRAEKLEIEARASDTGEENSCWNTISNQPMTGTYLCARNCMIDIRQGAFLDHPLANASVIRNGS